MLGCITYQTLFQNLTWIVSIFQSSMTKLVDLFTRSVTRKSYHNDTKYHMRINSLLIVVILVDFTTTKTYNIKFNFRGEKRKTIRLLKGSKMLFLQYPTFVEVSVKNKIV